MEQWKDIKGYEGLYQVSSIGRVKSLERMQTHMQRLTKERILKPVKGNKYLYVSLKKDNVKTQKTIHRLVALNFLKQVQGKNCVNHIDGNPHNNNLSNLEMVDYSENGLHAYRIGLNKRSLGEKANGAKLKTEDVLNIREKHSLGQITRREAVVKYNVSYGQIINIINRKSWQHV